MIDTRHLGTAPDDAEITTMGRLTASVAQPIATIVTNAQAARNFLDHRPPNLNEVRQALDCIVRDAYRASDVIERIRGLFKETPPKKERVEVNGAIRDVHWALGR
jgi:C4-dicarboxylate-specific signal transduction histidine kinase